MIKRYKNGNIDLIFKDENIINKEIILKEFKDNSLNISFNEDKNIYCLLDKKRENIYPLCNSMNEFIDILKESKRTKLIPYSKSYSRGFLRKL